MNCFNIRCSILLALCVVTIECKTSNHSTAKSAADSLDILLDKFFEEAGTPTDETENVPTNDRSLTSNQKMAKMAACFNLVQQHIEHHKKAYGAAAVFAATRKGLREDDAMRLFYHSTLVACYDNLSTEDFMTHIKAFLDEREVIRILWRDENTAMQLSEVQYELLGKVVADQQERGAPHKVSAGQQWQGPSGIIYVLLALTAMGGLLVMAAIKLVKMERLKKGKRSKKEKTATGRIEKKKHK